MPIIPIRRPVTASHLIPVLNWLIGEINNATAASPGPPTPWHNFQPLLPPGTVVGASAEVGPFSAEAQAGTAGQIPEPQPEENPPMGTQAMAGMGQTPPEPKPGETPTPTPEPETPPEEPTPEEPNNGRRGSRRRW